MDREILEFYSLRTLDPHDWRSDTVHTHNASIASGDTNTSDPTAPLSYQQLLKDVTKDDLTTSPGLLDPVDPLDPVRRIRQVLQERGSAQLSNEMLLKLSIASKEFNSKVFLKLIHNDDSFSELLESLHMLERSIEEQDTELRGLIVGEFLKFVRSKSSLDDVLFQFQEKGFRIKEGMEEKQNDTEKLIDLKNALNHATKKTTLLIKPILNSKIREDKLKKSIEFVEKKKFLFDLPKKLKIHLKSDDYENFIHDYKKAKSLIEELHNDNAGEENRIIDRIWETVEIIIESYKAQLWTQLTQDQNNDEFLKIIGKLLELDEIDNPILIWIELKWKKLLNKFNDIFNKYHDRVMNVQLNIMSTVDHQDYRNFRSVLSGSNLLMDYTIVIEMWLTIYKLFVHLDTLIKEFINFWTNVESFLNGKHKERLISNYVSSDSQFLQFQEYEIQGIKSKGEKFIDQIIHKFIKFFMSTQESLKSLSHTPSDKTVPNSASSTELSGTIQDFGFLPPFTNTLSTLRYLPLIATQTYKILNDLGQLTITDRITSELRDASDIITEKFIGAVCASWLNDCENFFKLEDWTRLHSGETTIPNLILNFETFVIKNLGELLNKTVPTSSNAVTIVRYPKKRLLQGIQIQFLRSFDVLLRSVIQKIIEENKNTSIPINVKNNHKLLTFFNLRTLEKKILPSILSSYDSVFDSNLKSQELEVYPTLERLQITIFDSYMSEQKKTISNILTKSILIIDWSDLDSKVTKVSPYIYEVLNVLLSVYISVLSVSSDLIERVFQHLLEHASSVLLRSFRDVTSFSDAGFKQAVLDIEFFKSLIGKSANDLIRNNIKLIYTTFQSAQLDIKGAYAAIGDALDKSLESSSIEYEIFNA